MNYEKQNDSELLSLIAESNEDASAELVKKYTGLVHTLAKKHKIAAQILGIDEKDLIQEGFVGLTKAIETYNLERNVLFYTYVTICVESSIKSALKSANKKRNISLNISVSLDELIENENININEILKDELSDPSFKIEDAETCEEVIKDAKKLLTSFEYKVFNLKTKGYSNEEIANATDKPKKSIENTIFRIKQKLKENEK